MPVALKGWKASIKSKPLSLIHIIVSLYYIFKSTVKKKKKKKAAVDGPQGKEEVVFPKERESRDFCN